MTKTIVGQCQCKALGLVTDEGTMAQALVVSDGVRYGTISATGVSLPNDRYSITYPRSLPSSGP